MTTKISRLTQVAFLTIGHRRRNYSSAIDLNYVSIPEDCTKFGDKTPLLIIHGLFGHTGNWSSMSKSFQQTLRRPVVVADLRNHGLSPHTDEMSYEIMTEDVEKLIHKISPVHKTCIILGHSLGGKVASHLALTKSHLVEKLIVADIVPRSTSPNEETDMAPILRAMHKVQLSQQKQLTEARRKINLQLEEYGIKDATVRAFLLTNLMEKDGKIRWKMNLESISKFIYDVHTFPEESLSHKFSKPALFIFGGKSSFYKGSADDWYLQKIFLRLKVHVIENCGHWLHAENPKEFMHVVIDFITNSESS